MVYGSMAERSADRPSQEQLTPRETAQERAQRLWRMGGVAVSLVNMREVYANMPERNDHLPIYDDKTGNIILGYN